MICAYCRFPIDFPASPESSKLARIGNVPSFNLQLRCTHCGAKYQVDVFVDSGPDLSAERVKQIRNKVS